MYSCLTMVQMNRGSVNRSPLSVNTIFNNWASTKMSPTDPQVSSAADPLASSTWAYTPAADSGALAEPGWAGGISNNNKSRPPPGLSSGGTFQTEDQTSTGAGGASAANNDPSIQNLMCLLNSWLAKDQSE